MPRLAVVLIVACGIGAAGCQSSSSPDETGSLIENEPVTPLMHEVYTGFREPARIVVRNSRRWAEVWARAFVGRSEVPQRPTIDFSKEMVLVAAQGGQGSSGYDISIDRVASRDGGLAVDVTSTSPDERCFVLTVVTSPVVMVRVPRSVGRVEYIEHDRVMSCVD
jgi:hypothetical protein